MTENIVEIKHASKSFADQQVLRNISLTVKAGEFLTLLGPSGCGKTTLLRLISGFEQPTSGQIIINGKDMVNTPPSLRHVNTVFQSYALFPHMTVYQNVAFGLQCRGVAKEQIQEKVMAALAMVKLDKFSQRKPKQLSGGQQQRVAIARAVVNEPLVLLLDEPLSSLDYRLRKAMQLELKQLQRNLGIAFVFVTHDQEEALSMSDRVVILDEGHVEQIGTPREVYEEPVSLAVAKFIGETNIFDTEVLAVKDNKITVTVEQEQHEYTNKRGFVAGQKVHVVVRPEDVRAWDKVDVPGVTGAMLPGVVEEVIYKGTTVDLMVRLASGKVVATTEFFDEDDPKLEYSIGEKVWVEWTPGWEVILPYEV
jgi:spermidine/putrescine transport system ATP-binding protein